MPTLNNSVSKLSRSGHGQYKNGQGYATIAVALSSRRGETSASVEEVKLGIAANISYPPYF